MIQKTVNRLLPIVEKDDIFIVTNAAYIGLVKQQLPEIPEQNILAEPCARNTAPCIGLGAIHISRKYEDAIMMVLPSDHLIKYNQMFVNTLKDAIERIMPYWESDIFPSLKTAHTLLVVAHGNSLRGIIKHLKNISDEDIVKLNLPTAVPYVFEFDENLNVANDYFLGNPEEIKKLMEAVANQGKKK
jgi:hypothetical protein